MPFPTINSPIKAPPPIKAPLCFLTGTLTQNFTFWAVSQPKMVQFSFCKKAPGSWKCPLFRHFLALAPCAFYKRIYGLLLFGCTILLSVHTSVLNILSGPKFRLEVNSYLRKYSVQVVNLWVLVRGNYANCKTETYWQVRSLHSQVASLMNRLRYLIFQGYYKRGVDYFPIRTRKKQGVFKVPMVHSTVLIDLNVAKSSDLGYAPAPPGYDVSKHIKI